MSLLFTLIGQNQSPDPSNHLEPESGVLPCILEGKVQNTQGTAVMPTTIITEWTCRAVGERKSPEICNKFSMSIGCLYRDDDGGGNGVSI